MSTIQKLNPRPYFKRHNQTKEGLDSEIEDLYQQILQKVNSGITEDPLLSNNEKLFPYIHYLLSKPVKSASEIYIIKLFLYKMKQFMSLFENLNISLDTLMIRIITHLKCEEYSPGKIVCKQGDKGDKFYLILNGIVSVAIPKESTVKMSKLDYLQFLLKLYLYQEYELISKTIHINRHTYFIDEKDFIYLANVFKLYTYHIKTENETNNNTNQQQHTQFIDEFISNNKVLNDLLDNKYESSLSKCLNIMDLDELEMRKAYGYFYTKYNEIHQQYIQFKKTESSYIRFANTKLNSLLKNIPSHSIKTTIHHYNTTIKKSSLLKELSSHIELCTNILNNPCFDNEFIYTSTIDNYINRLLPDISKTHTSYENINSIKVYKYVEIVLLKDGNIFGDIALQNSSNKRTATIITKTNSVFGTLTKGQYDICLKTAQDKIRSLNILFFLTGPIFKKVGQKVFESKYFNCFRHVELQKGMKLFEKGNKREKIFFIKKGEVELRGYMSFNEVNQIITKLGYDVDERDEHYYMNNYPLFKKYYKEDKHDFKIYLMKDNEIAGLDEFILNDEFYCDCVVTSPDIELFELEIQFYMTLFEDFQIKKNLNDYLQLKRNVIGQRLINMRTSKLEGEKSKIKFDENIELRNNYYQTELNNKSIKSIRKHIFMNINLSKHTHRNNNVSKMKLTLHKDFNTFSSNKIIEQHSITSRRKVNTSSSNNNNHTDKKDNSDIQFHNNTVSSSIDQRHKMFIKSSFTDNNNDKINLMSRVTKLIKTKNCFNKYQSTNYNNYKNTIPLSINKQHEQLTLSSPRVSQITTSEKQRKRVFNLVIQPKSRSVYKNIRTKKIINRTNKIGQVKEYRTQYSEKRSFNPTCSNFYLKNMPILKPMSNRKDVLRNLKLCSYKGFMDPLIFDKWAEKQINGSKNNNDNNTVETI